MTITEGRQQLTALQYKLAAYDHALALMSYDGVELVFENEALDAVADRAIERKIGARGLRSVMEGVMTDLMYEIPSDPTVKKVTITADCVNKNEKAKIEHINR